MSPAVPRTARPSRPARLAALLATAVGTLVLLACGAADRSDVETDAAEPIPVRSGGMTTAFDEGPDAFSLSARNINHYERLVFADGKDLFETEWTEEPTDGLFGGLGPAFDAVACSRCHIDDGRGPGPSGDGPLPEGMIVMLRTDDPDTIARHGTQLQRRTVDGLGVQTTVAYEEIEGTYDDGETYRLRAPVYRVEPGVDPRLPDDAVLAPRVPPALVGLGLLELIAEDDLAEAADPDDTDGDGVSGRVSVVEHLLLGYEVTGRFGWQAESPTVEQQAATALFHDMGLTSRYFPTPGCTLECDRFGRPLDRSYRPDAGGAAEYDDYDDDDEATGYGDGPDALDVEVDDQQLYELTVYTQTLAVPAARSADDPAVQQGRARFDEIGCSACHTAPQATGAGPFQGLSGQAILPYTDLLLHDMGDGLADRTAGGSTVPTEWRTPPLWGIGLVETVNGHSTFLHDGRARNLTEAILWHGGEAATSRERFRALSADDRDALVQFLQSL